MEGARKLTPRQRLQDYGGFSDRTRGFVVGGYRRLGLRILQPLQGLQGLLTESALYLGKVGRIIAIKFNAIGCA